MATVLISYLLRGERRESSVYTTTPVDVVIRGLNASLDVVGGFLYEQDSSNSITLMSLYGQEGRTIYFKSFIVGYAADDPTMVQPVLKPIVVNPELTQMIQRGSAKLASVHQAGPETHRTSPAIILPFTLQEVAWAGSVSRRRVRTLIDNVSHLQQVEFAKELEIAVFRRLASRAEVVSLTDQTTRCVYCHDSNMPSPPSSGGVPVQKTTGMAGFHCALENCQIFFCRSCMFSCAGPKVKISGDRTSACLQCPQFHSFYDLPPEMVVAVDERLRSEAADRAAAAELSDAAEMEAEIEAFAHMIQLS